MKVHNVITAILLATAFFVRAQEPAPPVLDVLSTNYQITIAGSLGKTDPMDVTLRGSSRVFAASLQDPIRSVEIRVMNEKDPLSILYTIGARIAVKTGGNNVQYQDISVTGSFLATLGQPFPVLQIDDSKLTIQVDKIPEGR